MKNFFKKFLLSSLVLGLTITFTGGNVKALNIPKPKIEVKSWPGRPGNPDGIGVETNTYSCTQNWKFIPPAKSGRAEALRDADNTNMNKNITLLTTLITLPAGLYLNSIKFTVGSSIFGLASGFLYKSSIKGDLYTAYTYESSDCIKIVYEMRYFNGSYAETRVAYAKK